MEGALVRGHGQEDRVPDEALRKRGREEGREGGRKEGRVR